MNSSICALGGMHQKNFEMRNFKKILLKIENVEKMHQKILKFFYISKKNEIYYTHLTKNSTFCLISSTLTTTTPDHKSSLNTSYSVDLSCNF